MKVTETHSNQRVLERTNSYSDYAWLPSNAKPSHCSKSAGHWAPCFAEGLCHFKGPFCSESLHPGSTASLREAINLAVCFIFAFVSALSPQGVPAHTQCSGKECYNWEDSGHTGLAGFPPPMNCYYIIFLIQPYFCTAVQLSSNTDIKSFTVGKEFLDPLPV